MRQIWNVGTNNYVADYIYDQKQESKWIKENDQAKKLGHFYSQQFVIEKCIKKCYNRPIKQTNC